MKSNIIIIGGGASGLMAAYHAAKTAVDAAKVIQVTVLEKMPRPARKIMISGKGRCNFTNLKDWNSFSGHIQSKVNFIKPAFYNLPSDKTIAFFESFGMNCIVERGDRAFPVSHHASEVVDTLVSACHSVGVKIELESEVSSIEKKDKGFAIKLKNGGQWLCDQLIIATGGLSYPSTGSTGDAYQWAKELGHSISTLFPSLTALVPKDYKLFEGKEKHIHRDTPLSPRGESLCGVQLKNIQASLYVDGLEAQSEFGDIDFTDGGIEGPVGFQLSRKAVKSMINGSSVSLSLDLKPGVPLTELSNRIKELWQEIDKDPRSRRLKEKERCRILLGKLMPWELIPAFKEMHPEIITLERRSRSQTKVWINLISIAKALKDWRFELTGHVGYERAVVTAGGINTEEIIPKTMASRIVEGLYFCGEVLDIDADTGGYNLQSAFSTGALAGRSAAIAQIHD